MRFNSDDQIDQKSHLNNYNEFVDRNLQRDSDEKLQRDDDEKFQRDGDDGRRPGRISGFESFILARTPISKIPYVRKSVFHEMKQHAVLKNGSEAMRKEQSTNTEKHYLRLASGEENRARYWTTSKRNIAYKRWYIQARRAEMELGGGPSACKAEVFAM